MGNYALTLCRHIFEKDYPLRKVGGISKYIRDFNVENTFSFEDKKILLFPFLHPSNRNRNKDEKIEDNEEKFSEKIREIQH